MPTPSPMTAPEKKLTHYLKSFLAELDLCLAICGFEDIASLQRGRRRTRTDIPVISNITVLQRNCMPGPSTSTTHMRPLGPTTPRWAWPDSGVGSRHGNTEYHRDRRGAAGAPTYTHG